MTSFAIIALLSLPAHAVKVFSTAVNGIAITPTSVTSNLISGATVQLLQNGATLNTYPNAPLTAECSVNGACQYVLQNLSNGTNATSDVVLTTDLGGNTTFFLDLFTNSSKYSQSYFGVEPSSAAGMQTSDMPLFLWAGVNGVANGGPSPYIVLGSSAPSAANAQVWITTGGAIVSTQLRFQGPGSTIAFAGGVYISTSVGGSSTTANIALLNTTGQTIFTPNLSSFTVSAALSGTFTTTTLGPCIANSTMSLTLPNGNSLIQGGFRGSISDGNLAANVSVGILLDGALTDGETTTKGFVSIQQAVLGDTENFSFPFFISGLSAGTHNVCFTALAGAGTGTIDSTNSVAKIWMYTLP